MSIYLGRNKVSIKYNGSASLSPQPTPEEKYNQVCAKVKFCQDKLIEEGGKGSYAGAWICLRDDSMDYEDFSLNTSYVKAIKTSDGYTYTYSQGSTISHQWDKTKDFNIEGAGNEKYRWVIYYYNSSSINSNVTYLDCAKAYNQIYVFDMELKFYSVTSGSTHNSYGLFSYNDVLQSFDFINNHKCTGATSTNFVNFCFHCQSLVKLPDNLDTSLATDFTNFCGYCYSLFKLPDNIDTSSGNNFFTFCEFCYSLKKIPDNLDTSSGNNFQWFCQYCQSLTKLPDNLDVSSGTNFYGFCQYCYSLVKLPDSINTSKGTNFAYFCYYCYSLTNLPDNLDTSSGTAFYGFCSNCYSLTKLPDNLDVSSGTKFAHFCEYCYSLNKLPDGLNTSKGTDFPYFCSYCYSLTNLPDNLNVSLGTSFTCFCCSCYSLTKLPNNLIINGNISGFCQGCYSLKKVNIVLPSGYSMTSLNGSNYLTVESMKYISDHAPTVTTTRTLTIGSTNIARANKYDTTIISNLNSKGWTVN